MNDAAPPLSRPLPEVIAPIAADMERVAGAYRQILADVTPHSRDLVAQSASFTGKRLRPALTLIAGRAACGRVPDDVATVAAVIELIHTATLVHDDILDEAELRRRVPTLNAQFGQDMAVLVGDVLFSKAYRAAAWLDDPFAARYLSEVVAEVLEGEIFQDLVAHDATIDEAAYRRIIRGKTAALYEGALRVGAHYGGADKALTDALGAYGHHLGMAFQIVDDRLDLTGDEAVTGKSAGRDLGEGKTTLPVIRWLAAQDEAVRSDALARVAAAWNNPEAAARLCEELASSGALAQADAAARDEIEQARRALDGHVTGDEHELLIAITEFVLKRTL